MEGGTKNHISGIRATYQRQHLSPPYDAHISAVCMHHANIILRLIADKFGPGKVWYFDEKIGLYPLADFRVAKSKFLLSHHKIGRVGC